jgi:hypothetical protein
MIGVPGQPEHGCGGYFSGLSATLHDDYSPASNQGANELFPLHDLADDAGPRSGPHRQVHRRRGRMRPSLRLDPAGLTAHLKIVPLGIPTIGTVSDDSE